MTGTDTPWPGARRAAVSFSFDDGGDTHPDICAPLFEDFDLRATFYAPINSPMLKRPDDWRALSERGHELGNHTIFHPCIKHGQSEWLADCYDLKGYSTRRWHDEVDLANRLLALIDGEQPRTFGNTCHNNWLGTGAGSVKLETLMARHFLAARGGARQDLVDATTANRWNLGTRSLDQRSGSELIAAIDEARAQGRWLIITCHEVRADDAGLSISPTALREACAHLVAHADEICTAPVRSIAEHLFAPVT